MVRPLVTTKKTMQIGKYELKGGGCCPEQYDVFLDGKEVAYLRMRHGCFTAELTVEGQITTLVYEDETPQGDGCFYDEEREKYLNAAINAINDKLHAKRPNDRA